MFKAVTPGLSIGLGDRGESVEAEGVEEKEKQEWSRRGTGMILPSTSGSSL